MLINHFKELYRQIIYASTCYLFLFIICLLYEDTMLFTLLQTIDLHYSFISLSTIYIVESYYAYFYLSHYISMSLTIPVCLFYLYLFLTPALLEIFTNISMYLIFIILNLNIPLLFNSVIFNSLLSFILADFYKELLDTSYTLKDFIITYLIVYFFLYLIIYITSIVFVYFLSKTVSIAFIILLFYLLFPASEWLIFSCIYISYFLILRYLVNITSIFRTA